MLPRLPLLLLSVLGLAALTVPRPARGDTPPSPLADGGAKLAAGDAAGAMRSLETVTRARPNDAEAFRLLAVACLHANQDRKAMDAAEAAVRLSSADNAQRATAAVLLGKARYGAFDHAYNALFSKAQSLPNMNQLLSQMASHQFPMPSGAVIVEKGDQDAQDDFISMHGSVKDEITRLNATLKKAEEAYKDALAADPHAPGVHDGLGLVLIAQGYPGDARREFRTELLQHGPSGAVYHHLGELDAAEGRDADALENLRRGVTLSPQMHGPYDDLAALYARRGDKNAVQWARGMSALVLGNLGGAQAEFGKAKPTADVCRGQAQLALARKKPDEARAWLDKAQALATRDAATLAARGDLEESLGHHAEAIALYKQAIDVDANCDAAWYGIGLAYDAQKDRESALADYTQALQVNPNNPLAKLNLAQDQADLGRRAEAVATLRDYLQRFPTASNTYDVWAALKQLDAK